MDGQSEVSEGGSKSPVGSEPESPCGRDLRTDPRTDPAFQPQHFPLCDGGAPPPVGTGDRTGRRQIEFLAAYYRLNQLLARLEAIRAGTTSGDELAALREIQGAIRERDAIEDRYEAEGFIGEPVMEGLYYRDIEFTHALSRRFYSPTVSSRFSLSLPIPAPGTDLESLIHHHLGSLFPGAPDEPSQPPDPP
jgi:hypothetical protein